MRSYESTDNTLFIDREALRYSVLWDEYAPYIPSHQLAKAVIDIVNTRSFSAKETGELIVGCAKGTCKEFKDLKEKINGMPDSQLKAALNALCKRDFFLEGLPVSDESAKQETWEAEADEFARDFLIPPEDWDEFVADGIFEEATIDRFAKRQGIAAGIVVGRLQHEHLLSHRTHLNSKKFRLKWADD